MHTCCDQRGGTNWANTHTHTHTHTPKTTPRQRTRNDKGEKQHCLQYQNKYSNMHPDQKSYKTEQGVSVLLTSVAKRLHRPRWRARTEKKGRTEAGDREGVRKWE